MVHVRLKKQRADKTQYVLSLLVGTLSSSLTHARREQNNNLIPKRASGVKHIRICHLELVIVQERITVGHAQKEPSEALVVGRRLGVLDEQALPERAVRGNASTGGHHDDVGFGLVLREEHDLAGRAGHLHFGAWGRVAQVVGAHALEGRKKHTSRSKRAEWQCQVSIVAFKKE